MFLSSLTHAQPIETIAGGGPNHLQALDSNIAGPTAVAFDPAGNLYFVAREGHLVFGLDESGGLHIVAGIGVDGFSGDNGESTRAHLRFPSGIAFDQSGNLFIADTYNRRVRKVDAETGIITTVLSSLDEPREIAFDGADNLFIVDGSRVLRLDGLSGELTQVPGACCSSSFNIDIDGSGDLYLADASLDRILKYSFSTYTWALVAGGGTLTGDNVPATEARVNPASVVVDASGNIFFGESSRIRRVDAGTGLINTIAPARSPVAMRLSPAGDLVYADSTDNQVFRLEIGTGTKTLIAGNGSLGFSGEMVPATQASLNWPAAVAYSADGDLLIADRKNNRIRSVDLATGLIHTLAGRDSGPSPGDGGDAALARFNDPRGIAVDSRGNILIADTISCRVRRIDATDGTIETMVGTGVRGFSGDGGPAAEAQLAYPWGLLLDPEDNLYIADQLNDRVRRVDAMTGVITTIAGADFAPLGDGGPAIEAGVSQPIALAMDADRNLYVASAADRRVRRIDAATGIISTVAGNGNWPSSGDGRLAVEASLSPSGVLFNARGDLFISDGPRIRVVDHCTGIIRTFRGSLSGLSSARMYNPSGLVFSLNQTAMYVADTFNNRIRRIAPLTSNRVPPPGRRPQGCEEDLHERGSRGASRLR